jgi:hypothetical protein
VQRPGNEQYGEDYDRAGLHPRKLVAGAANGGGRAN